MNRPDISHFFHRRELLVTLRPFYSIVLVCKKATTAERRRGLKARDLVSRQLFVLEYRWAGGSVPSTGRSANKHVVIFARSLVTHLLVRVFLSSDTHSVRTVHTTTPYSTCTIVQSGHGVRFWGDMRESSAGVLWPDRMSCLVIGTHVFFKRIVFCYCRELLLFTLFAVAALFIVPCIPGRCKKGRQRADEECSSRYPRQWITTTLSISAEI